MPTTVSNAVAAHDALAKMTEELIGDYESTVPAGSVIRLVARTVHDLRAAGVPAQRLATATEPIVRGVLDARAGVERSEGYSHAAAC